MPPNKHVAEIVKATKRSLLNLPYMRQARVYKHEAWVEGGCLLHFQLGLLKNPPATSSPAAGRLSERPNCSLPACTHMLALPACPCLPCR
jgi:hypothetical protein